MRIVVDRGRHPGSVLPYLLRSDKREKGREEENPIFHTNMFGCTVEELTEEFRFSADQNLRVARTYVQYKVSFPPGENPDRETKVGVVDDLLELRGHGRGCQFLAVEHFEKIHKHDVHHLHVLASTVRLDGAWVDDAFERVKLKDVERAIELRRGLRVCSPKPKGLRVNTSIREVKLQEQGQSLVKDRLRAALERAIQDRPTMPLLMARVKAQGLAMQFYEFSDGKGVSFGTDGWFFQGRQLGDRFSFHGLSVFAGVNYLPHRDDPLLRSLNDFDAITCGEILPLLEAARTEGAMDALLATDGMADDGFRHLGGVALFHRDELLWDAEQEKEKEDKKLKQQLSKLQEIKEQEVKEQEIKERREAYRDRYHLFSPPQPLPPLLHDLWVASQALRALHDPTETLLILANSTYAQTLLQNHGRAAALSYAQSLTQLAHSQLRQGKNLSAEER